MREQLSRFRPGPTLKAAAVFAAFFLLFVGLDRLSGPGEPDDGTAVASTETTTTAPETTTEPGTAEEPETGEPSETTPPEGTAGEEPAAPGSEEPATDEPEGGEPPPTTAAPAEETPAEPPAPLRSAEGVTLQVLNGTGELRLARDFKPLASQEGYQIVNSGNTAGHYPVSTIFYTPDHREDAEAFQARFPAFEVVAPAPDTLSDTVALHAVLGENYEP